MARLYSPCHNMHSADSTGSFPRIIPEERFFPKSTGEADKCRYPEIGIDFRGCHEPPKRVKKPGFRCSTGESLFFKPAKTMRRAGGAALTGLLKHAGCLNNHWERWRCLLLLHFSHNASPLFNAFSDSLSWHIGHFLRRKLYNGNFG